MPVLQYFGVVGSALLALLFVSDAFLRDDESGSRFDASLYQSILYEPRLDETVVTPEPRFTRDATPADRVKEVFAQFVPSEARRARRYSSASAATVIR